MTQQQNAGQPKIREEERVFGISYERALAMLPRLIRDTTGAEAQALGDGYFVAEMESEDVKRELTFRLGRQGPDTRFSLRVETTRDVAHWRMAIFVVVTVVTAGIGAAFLAPWLMRLYRQEARARDLLVHKTFRAIEDAVAAQGESNHYRVAPGADAAAPDDSADESPAEAAETRSRRA
jgi:hypothetical protein